MHHIAGALQLDPRPLFNTAWQSALELGTKVRLSIQTLISWFCENTNWRRLAFTALFCVPCPCE